MKDNRSFFERLTGSVPLDEGFEEEQSFQSRPTGKTPPNHLQSSPIQNDTWSEPEPEEGEIAVDVYQTAGEIVIKSMVAGVKPEDLDISIARDTVTIKGKRETERFVKDEDYYHRELYWGSFSRTIMLPAEIEVEEADAIEKHGLLIIRLPKIDKNKHTRLKVKG